VVQPDNNPTIRTRFVKLTWDYPGGGAGCGTPWGHNCDGNNNREFTLKIDNNSNFSSPIINKTNLPTDSTSYTTTSSDGPLTTNRTYYAQVCAVNSDSACIDVTFVKEAYPEGETSGLLGEFDPDSTPPYTTTGISGASTVFTLDPEDNEGITTSCTTDTLNNPPTTTRYECTILVDNVNSDPLPQQNYALNAIGYDIDLYSNPCFRVNDTTCDANTDITVDLDVNNIARVVIDQDVYFRFNPLQSFIKIKNSSVLTRAALPSRQPAYITMFDAIDDYPSVGVSNGNTDLRSDNYLIIGDGIGLYDGVGTGAFKVPLSNGSSLVSIKSLPNPPGKNWQADNYSTITSYSYLNFQEYIKTRKTYQIIQDLSELAPDQINMIEGDLVITSADVAYFDNEDITLLVTGRVDFDTDEFIPAVPSSTAIIANRINFFLNGRFVREARGIFIGTSVEFGSSSVPLKIVGNLITTFQPVPLTRVRDDNRKPSVFIVFDPYQYVRLLPHLSIATYDWDQLQ